MRRPYSPPPPPWLCCSAFNGTLYLILELAAMRFDGVSRWIFAAPISAAALGAVLWLFWGTSSATAAVHSTHPGVWGALARTAYSILEQASLVAGVATLLEVKHSFSALLLCVFYDDACAELLQVQGEQRPCRRVWPSCAYLTLSLSLSPHGRASRGRGARWWPCPSSCCS